MFSIKSSKEITITGVFCGVERALLIDREGAPLANTYTYTEKRHHPSFRCCIIGSIFTIMRVL